MLKVTEGDRAQGKVLLNQEVGTWEEARPMALRAAAESAGHPVTVEYGEDICQVVTLSKNEAKKILGS